LLADGTRAATSFTVTNDLTVNGNLTVNGTTTTLNTETLSVEDNIVVLNSGVTGSPTTNAGIEVERGTSDNVAIIWNETTDKWQFTNDGTTYINFDTAGPTGATGPTGPTGATGATGPTGPEQYVTISSGAPVSPSAGEMWFDSDTGQTFIYYDSSWVEIGGIPNGARITVSSTAPSSPLSGELWFDSDDGATYVYFDGVWVEVGATAVDVLLSTINAKGDLLVGTADNTVDNLTVGTNGQILVANSSTSTGLEWQTPTYASTGKAIAMSIVFGG
jgi:hypothetical protein